VFCHLYNYDDFVLHVVPGAPTRFTVQALTSTTVQLSWGAPDVTNGIIQNYTVVYSNGINNFMIIYDKNAFDGTITSLSGDTTYNFAIYANTSAGAGPNASATLRTSEAG